MAGPPLGFHHGGVSLLTGWLPLTLQIVAGMMLALTLVLTVACPGRRRLRWLLPVGILSGALFVALTSCYISSNGLSSDPAPTMMWIWIGLTGLAASVAVRSWRGTGWGRRALASAAAVTALLCVGIGVNDWVGYLPTVAEAWSQLNAGPLPDQVDADQLAALRGTGSTMTIGKLVAVDIPNTVSHFNHRTEYVYLPPAWFDQSQPALPVIMMIAGEFNTPADWIRVGNAVQTVDAYAKAHNGVAPVLVFVDSGGSFNNDTECVDGPRGNAADHLTKEIQPYVVAHFHTATDPARWGIVGWSAGGTCAVDLAVMHPELFDTFVDIAGDLGPNAGDKQRTIEMLYGGDAKAWAAYDPTTVLAGHAPYPNTAGWFDNAAAAPRAGHRPGGRRPFGPGFHLPRQHTSIMAAGQQAGYGGRHGPGDFAGAGTNEAAAAAQLCTEASAKNISCTLHTQAGRHSWQFASTAFSDALPWLADALARPADCEREAQSRCVR
jgi:S-formylglutathione hydrolase FrmB